MAGQKAMLNFLFIFLAFISGFVLFAPSVLASVTGIALVPGITIQVIIGGILIILAGLQLLPMILKR